MRESRLSDLRKQFRDRRRALAPQLRELANQRIAALLDGYPPVQAAQCIAAYLSVDGEVDLWPWLQTTGTRKCLALPVIEPACSATVMAFHRFRPGDDLVPNRFSIPEPAGHTKRIKPKKMDVMLLPLVAFDADGTRMGMGAGYYDRYLGAAKHRPTLIGVAYACQQTAHLDRQEWDIPLDAVVTEDGIIEFKS